MPSLQPKPNNSIAARAQLASASAGGQDRGWPGESNALTETEKRARGQKNLRNCDVVAAN